MLPTELDKLRQQIVGNKNPSASQKALLAEIEKIDRFFTAIPGALTASEIKTQMIKEGLEKRGAFAVTSGPGGTCNCCGRNL